jgi:hypothetical protein
MSDSEEEKVGPYKLCEYCGKYFPGCECANGYCEACRLFYLDQCCEKDEEDQS